MTRSDKLTRRSFLLATGATAASVAVAGCNSGNDGTQVGDGSNETQVGGGNNETRSTNVDDEPNTSTQTETDGESDSPADSRPLNLISSGVRTLDTIPATTASDSEVSINIFDGLTLYPNGKPQVESLLATEYQLKDNNKSYQFSLKNGVKFHNDATMTASDFVYSWERLAASTNSGRDNYLLDILGVDHETDAEGNYVPNSMSVTAVDDRTLEVTLREPFHAALQMFAYPAFAVLPEGIVGDIGGYNGTMNYKQFARNPVGCGPFAISVFSAGDSISIEAFEDYHGNSPDVPGVNWSIATEPSTTYNIAMNKNVDVFQMPTSNYEPGKISIETTDNRGRKSGTYGSVRNGETLNYLQVPLISTNYIGFNTSTIPKPVRQAVAYAINQRVLNEQIFKGRNEPATHFTPPSIYPGGVEAYDRHAHQYPYGSDESRLDDARAVLEDAGYNDENRFELTMSAYSSEWVSVARLLRDQLRSAYVDIEIRETDLSALASRLLNGKGEVYTLGWSFDWPAPDNFLQLLYPPKTDTSASNNVGFTNWNGTPAANRATNAWENKIAANIGPGNANKDARNEGYVAIEEANWEDMVQLPIYHDTDERLSYRTVSYPKFGSGGFQRQMKNEYKISGSA